MNQHKLGKQIRKWDRAYKKRVVRGLRRRGVQLADALDAWQNTMMKASRYLSNKWVEPRDPGAWLWTIAWHEAVNILGKQSKEVAVRERERTRQSEIRGSQVVDVLEALRQAHVREAIEAAISKLTPLQRDVLLRRFFEESSNVEIAKELRRSPSAIANVMHRALMNLRRLLCEEVVVK